MNDNPTTQADSGRVSHPSYYNHHPMGIECIDIIRHYTCDVANAIKYLWRAGLKQEMGLQERTKEIEDLQKAVWYIEDMMTNTFVTDGMPTDEEEMAHYIDVVTGHSIGDIINGYEPHIAMAMAKLLRCGLVCHGMVRCSAYAATINFPSAIHYIKERIALLEGKDL